MTIQRELKLTDPSILIEENGEDENRTMTWTVSVNQIMDNPRDEQVVWTITLPNMTPEQVLCLGDQFKYAAGLAVDERNRLAKGEDFTVRIQR